MSAIARIRSAALTGVIALGFVVSSATASSAEPAAPQVPRAVSLAAQALTSALSTSSGVSFVNSGSTGFTTMDVISCSGQSDYPHKSTTTPGAADGKARSWCTAPVAEIHAQAELYRYLEGYGFTLVGIGALDYRFNSAGPVSSPAFDTCQGVTQYYVTFGRHHFVAPVGFEPPSISFNTQSPLIAVTC